MYTYISQLFVYVQFHVNTSEIYIYNFSTPLPLLVKTLHIDNQYSDVYHVDTFICFWNSYT
jgi:hypothetical protein